MRARSIVQVLLLGIAVPLSIVMLLPLIGTLIGMSIVPILSPLLNRPEGWPDDARARWDFLFGTSWQFCRDLPSGRVIVGPRPQVLMLELGRRCDGTVAYTYEPSPSLARPGMTVIPGGGVSFAVPRWSGTGLFEQCPHKLGGHYLAQARKLVAEAAGSPQVHQVAGPDLRAAAANIGAFTTDRLKGGGASGSTYFCGLEPSVTSSRVAPLHPPPGG